jgi:ribosome-binding protein aMBF1 (putative translation factor)
MEKKLSQKDVAQKVNEKPSVIQDYESSKATPNPQILGKLERVLGVKLRGMSVNSILLYLTSLDLTYILKVQTLGHRWRGPKSRNLTPP